MVGVELKHLTLAILVDVVLGHLTTLSDDLSGYESESNLIIVKVADEVRV